MFPSQRSWLELTRLRLMMVSWESVVLMQDPRYLLILKIIDQSNKLSTCSLVKQIKWQKKKDRVQINMDKSILMINTTILLVVFKHLKLVNSYVLKNQHVQLLTLQRKQDFVSYSTFRSKVTVLQVVKCVLSTMLRNKNIPEFHYLLYSFKDQNQLVKVFQDQYMDYQICFPNLVVLNDLYQNSSFP